MKFNPDDSVALMAFRAEHAEALRSPAKAAECLNIRVQAAAMSIANAVTAAVVLERPEDEAVLRDMLEQLERFRPQGT